MEQGLGSGEGDPGQLLQGGKILTNPYIYVYTHVCTHIESYVGNNLIAIIIADTYTALTCYC